jgi:DNA-binding NarL/FixJ family response regulator
LKRVFSRPLAEYAAQAAAEAHALVDLLAAPPGTAQGEPAAAEAAAEMVAETAAADAADADAAMAAVPAAGTAPEPHKRQSVYRAEIARFVAAMGQLEEGAADGAAGAASAASAAGAGASAMDNAATALEAGAFGYILKSDTADNIADSIADAVAGQPVVSKPVLKIIFRYIQKNTTHEGSNSISKAELRVMRLTKLGYDCKTIAEKLAISVQTVYVHNRRIFRKLGVNNRMAAVARLADLDLDSQAVFSE